MALLLSLWTLLLLGGYTYPDYYEATNMEPDIYASSDEEWTDWEGLDYELEDGGVQISRYKYYAPHIMYHFSLDEVPQETAVLKANMQLEGFARNTLSLMTVFAPGGNISLITDKDGRLGLMSGPEGEPEFSGSHIEMDREHDIYLFMDSPNREISAYVDGTRAVTIERDFESYPLQEVWLGSVWVGGSNDLGVPLGYRVNNFVLGDEDLIAANQSLLEFTQAALFSENPGLWAPFTFALTLLAASFVMWIVERRRNKGAGSGEDAEI